MEWEDVFQHLEKIIAFLIIAGSWIFGLFYRAFMQKPQQRQQRPPQAPPMRQGGDPAVQRAEPPQPARAQDPMNPRDEVQNFLENLRRQAEEAARQQEAARQVPEAPPMAAEPEEEDEWITVELDERLDTPPRPLDPRRRPDEARMDRPTPGSPLQRPIPTRSSKFEAPTPQALGNITPSRDGAGFYSPPGELQLPNWMTLEEMANVSRSDDILGIPVRDAILINEILARPRALRPLRPGGGSHSPKT